MLFSRGYFAVCCFGNLSTIKCSISIFKARLGGEICLSDMIMQEGYWIENSRLENSRFCLLSIKNSILGNSRFGLPNIDNSEFGKSRFGLRDIENSRLVNSKFSLLNIETCQILISNILKFKIYMPLLWLKIQDWEIQDVACQILKILNWKFKI